MKDLVTLFKALSDETRLRILKLLEHGELCVCDIVAAFDTNPLILGIRVGEVAVMPLDRLPQVVQRLGIEIAILSTPAAAAQEAADRLVAAGISSILNFTPTVLSVPPEVTIRNIDLAAEMQILSFHQTLKQAGAPVSLVHAVARCPMPSRRSRGRA